MTLVVCELLAIEWVNFIMVIRKHVFPLQALQMNGQKLFGIPMIVQPTMAEKNKLVVCVFVCVCVCVCVCVYLICSYHQVLLSAILAAIVINVSIF